MRGRLFFLAVLAVIVAVVLSISGVFGPIGPSKNSDTTENASAQKIIPLGSVTAPSVRWLGDVKPGDNGHLHLAFRVEGSSPLTTLNLKITPVTPMQSGLKIDQETREIPTWLLGNKAIDFDGDVDLTGSLMAGQPVTVQVVAMDEDRRVGTSDNVKITIPEHRFTQPLSQALYTLRKGLQQEPERRRNDALRALATLLQQRATFENQDLALLTLRSAAVRIALDDSKEGLQSALDLLWHAAILLEDSPAVNVTLSLRMSPKPEGAPSKPE